MYEVSINGDFGKSKKNTVKNFFLQNKPLVFLSICLLCGIFCGSMLVKFADKSTWQFINILFSNDVRERATKTLFESFIDSLSSTFVFIFVSFFMGLSMYGFIFVPFIPFAYGVCIGMSEVYLYLSHGLKGLLLYSFIFLPGIFVSSMAILLMTKEATSMSSSLSSLSFSKGNFNNSFSLKRYFVRSGYLIIIAVFSSIIELLSSSLFSRFFVV